MATHRGYSNAALQYLATKPNVTIAHLVELELPTIEGESVSGYYTDYGAPCLLYTSPSPRDHTRSRMPSSA